MDTAKSTLFLRKIHLFYNLTDDQLLQCGEKFSEDSFDAGQVILEQDVLADSFYLLYNGKVRVYRRRDGREEIVLLSIASNANESDRALAAAARRRKIPVLLRDVDQLVANRYEALTTSHVFVIDRQGILGYRGAVDNVGFRQRAATKFYLKEAVEALLAKRLPEITEVQPFGCTIVRYA